VVDLTKVYTLNPNQSGPIGKGNILGQPLCSIPPKKTSWASGSKIYVVPFLWRHPNKQTKIPKS